MTADTSRPQLTRSPSSAMPMMSRKNVTHSSAPHSVEREARRALLADPDLHFSTLVVRRIHDGVCLEGVMDIEDGTSPDVDGLLQQIDGITHVVNHVVRRCVPSKG